MFWWKSRSDVEISRRIYSYERIWNRKPINAYFCIDRFRGGDDWIEARNQLKSFVQTELLKDVARYPLGSISLYAAWSAIIPDVRPTHWISAGYRCQIERFEKIPIVRIPLSLSIFATDDRIIERIGGPVGWAVDSLPNPETLVLSGREKLVFASTLLNALALEVRDELGQWRI